MYSLAVSNNYIYRDLDDCMKNINVNIPLNNKSINLVSYTCTNSIYNWDINNNNIIIIEISLQFKILYTNNDSPILNILKYNTCCYDKFFLDDRIDGFSLSCINIRQALSPLSKIISTDLLFHNDKSIYLGVMLNNKLKINYGLSILYLVNSNDGLSYLYGSDIQFNNFNQISFDPKKYCNLSFSLYDYSIFYLSNNIIYNCSLISYKITTIFSNQFLKWFFNIDYNKFIMLKEEGTFSSFIFLNLNTKSEKIIYKCSGAIKHLIKLSYSKIFAFLLYKNNSIKLVILNISGDILFNDTVNFSSFYINDKGSFLIGTSTSTNTLTILDIKETSAIIIHMPTDKFIIDTIVFHSETIALLLGTDNEFHYIFAFNLISCNFTLILKSNFYISSMDIDYSGNIVFSSNELGLYNIYSMSLDGPPNIVLKLFSENISLLIRR